MSADNLVGQSLGQYELRALLGAGGMGAVYRAYQANLRREVAVKVLPSVLSQDATSIARFNREAEVSASLEHAHIIPVYDYGTQRGISYVVMRLLSGGSLADRLRYAAEENHPLPSLRETADLLRPLASALDYAHQQGVIHRDLKPGNIMFDHLGNAFLVDFGIAKLLSATTALTETGTGIGTPSFMSPEQWRSDALTPATDQYSLAIVAYVMLTGHLPFEAETPFQAMHKHLNEPPTPLQAHRPEVPAAVSLVLDRALAKEPAERFPTVTAFAQAFDSAITGADSKSTGFFSMKVPQRPARRTMPTSPAAAPRRPILVGALVTLLMLALLAVALMALRPPQTQEISAPTSILSISTVPPVTSAPLTLAATSVPVIIVLPSPTNPVPSVTSAPLTATSVPVIVVLPSPTNPVTATMPTLTTQAAPTETPTLTAQATLTKTPSLTASVSATPKRVKPTATSTVPVPTAAPLKVAAGQPLLLGLAVSLTGASNIPTGMDIQHGVELALKDRPTVTIGGQSFPLRLDVQDDFCTTQGGEAIAKTFIAQNAFAVVGPMCSNGCRTAAPLLDAAGFTSVSPSCTVTDLTQHDYRSFNRDVPSDMLQSLIAAEYLYHQLGIRKIATLSDNSHYGEGVVAMVAQHFTELGGTVVAAKSLTEGDLATLLPEIAAQHPELIYFGGTSEDAALLAQQRAGVDLPGVVLMGPDRMRAGDVATLSGTAADNIYGTSVLWPGSPALTALRQRYKTSYGQSPGTYYATAYDAVNLLLDAVEASATVDASGTLTLDRAALQAYLHTVKAVTGVTGLLNADGTGELTLTSIGVYRLVDGKFIQVATGRLNPDTGAIALEKTG